MDLCWQSNVCAFKYAVRVGHSFSSKEQASFVMWGKIDIKIQDIKLYIYYDLNFSLQMVTAAMRLKDAPWNKSSDQPRQHIKKHRHYFADKGPSSQSCAFSQ